MRGADEGGADEGGADDGPPMTGDQKSGAKTKAPKLWRHGPGAEAGTPKPERRSPFLGALQVIGRVPAQILRPGATKFLGRTQNGQDGEAAL